MTCWPGRSLCGFMVAWLTAYVAGLLCCCLASYGGPMAVASWLSGWLATICGLASCVAGCYGRYLDVWLIGGWLPWKTMRLPM